MHTGCPFDRALQAEDATSWLRCMTKGMYRESCQSTIGDMYTANEPSGCSLILKLAYLYTLLIQTLQIILRSSTWPVCLRLPRYTLWNSWRSFPVWRMENGQPNARFDKPRAALTSCPTASLTG